MSTKLHIICLTKSYCLPDFQCWYSYYSTFGDNTIIHVIDNDSSVDIAGIINKKDTYEKISGWPNQWVLFTDILNKNKYGFQPDDYIMFADDDEYFWFRNGWKQEIDSEFIQQETKILCIPQIYMGYRKLPEFRGKPYVYTALYRRNDESSQGKCIIKYDPSVLYSFYEPCPELGHIPFISTDGETWKRKSKCPGSDYTNTTYGLTCHDAGIRLYHYHLKSIRDWEMKWERGSAACKRHPYKADIKNNPGYGKYCVSDTTIYNFFKNFGIDFAMKLSLC